MAEWPQTVSDAYHNAREIESDDAFSVEVVPADLARQLYEVLGAAERRVERFRRWSKPGSEDAMIAQQGLFLIRNARARYEQEINDG